MTHPPGPFFALLGLLLLVAGCAHPVPLADADRAALGREPVIHVLQYETAPPKIRAAAKASVPAGAAVRRAAGADPAALVAVSFSHLIGKKQRLGNLRTESSRLARPVARSAAELHPRYRQGLALELWVNNWTFEPLTGNPGQYAMRFDGHSRLSRLDDGRVLWSSGDCRITGVQNREYRLSARDLTTGFRLRKVLTAARNECARQLARDFAATGQAR